MSNNVSPTNRLLELLNGDDPGKRPSPTQEVFKQVLEEYQKSRFELAKESAAALFKKAVELREKMFKLKRESEAQFSKFDKELGKIMNQIESNIRQAVPEAPQETPTEAALAASAALAAEVETPAE